MADFYPVRVPAGKALAIRPAVPRRAPMTMPESEAVLRFPAHGIDLSQGFNFQPPGTTPEGANVRAFEPGTGRMRGGQRPGLSRYVASAVNGSNFVQDVNTVVSMQGTPTQSSHSGRVVTLAAVAGGTIKSVQAGGSAWTQAVNGGGVLSSSALVRSSAMNQKLWFVDGSHYCYYDPTVGTGGTVTTWTASAGSMPVDSAGN